MNVDRFVDHHVVCSPSMQACVHVLSAPADAKGRPPTPPFQPQGAMSPMTPSVAFDKRQEHFPPAAAEYVGKSDLFGSERAKVVKSRDLFN